MVCSKQQGKTNSHQQTIIIRDECDLHLSTAHPQVGPEEEGLVMGWKAGLCARN
jgi:hypothetical protein